MSNMRDNVIYLAVLCLLCIGCQDKANISNRNTVSKDSSLAFMMKKFSLPYSEDLGIDSNSLVFYYTQSFDTSFLLHLKNKFNSIDGVFYEVLPIYHNNVNDFTIEEKQLLFYEGYSFTLDSAEWREISEEAKKLLSTGDNSKSDKACRDCQQYVLHHNLKTTKSNIESNARYKLFYRFLKELFLEDFIQKRKPIMHKAS